MKLEAVRSTSKELVITKCSSPSLPSTSNAPASAMSPPSKQPECQHTLICLRFPLSLSLCVSLKKLQIHFPSFDFLTKIFAASFSHFLHIFFFSFFSASLFLFPPPPPPPPPPSVSVLFCFVALLSFQFFQLVLTLQLFADGFPFNIATLVSMLSSACVDTRRVSSSSPSPPPNKLTNQSAWRMDSLIKVWSMPLHLPKVSFSNAVPTVNYRAFFFPSSSSSSSASSSSFLSVISVPLAEHSTFSISCSCRTSSRIRLDLFNVWFQRKVGEMTLNGVR